MKPLDPSKFRRFYKTFFWNNSSYSKQLEKLYSFFNSNFTIFWSFPCQILRFHCPLRSTSVFPRYAFNYFSYPLICFTFCCSFKINSLEFAICIFYSFTLLYLYIFSLCRQKERARLQATVIPRKSLRKHLY